MAEALKTLTIEDFSGGMDRQGGLVSRNGRDFYEMVNVHVTDGGKPAMRWRAQQVPGALDTTNAQGIWHLNGKHTTFAPRGAAVAHTLSGLDLVTLFFDKPAYTTTWTVLDAGVLSGSVVALIRHTFPGSKVTSIIKLHVFDGAANLPTFTTDPECPTNWSPTYPLNAYGEGPKEASFSDYAPVMAIAGDKVHISRPDGSVGHSAVLRPRVWNTRSAQSFLDDGVWYYFITPNSGVLEFLVPEKYADLEGDQKWAAYVLESYSPATRRWTQIAETSSTTPSIRYLPSATANPYTPAGANLTKLTVVWPGGADAVLRFRLLPKPAVKIVSGCYVNLDMTVIGGKVSYEGAVSTVASAATAGVPGGFEYWFLVNRPGWTLAQAVGVSGGMLPSSFNGWWRYNTGIVGQSMTNGGGGAASQITIQLTGTVTVVANTKTVTGAGTAFQTELAVGRKLLIGTETRTVERITSNTALEVDAAYSAASAGVAAYRDADYNYAYQAGDTGNDFYAALEARVSIELAGADDAGSFNPGAYSPSGGAVIALAPMQNRLLVMFKDNTQSWAVGATPAETRLLASVSGGAGPHTRPQPVTAHGFAALPTHTGLRLFSPGGELKDYLPFTTPGDKLYGIPLPDLKAAVWWAEPEILLTSGTAAGESVIWCLSFHPEAKVTAWSWWEVAGVTQIDRIYAADGFLYLQSGSALYFFDAYDTTFATDAGGAYSARVRSLYNDLGKSRSNVRIQAMNICQKGDCSLELFASPAELTDSVPGPSLTGYTQGAPRIPLGFLAPGVAYELSSSDPTGWELYSVAFDFRLLNR